MDAAVRWLRSRNFAIRRLRARAAPTSSILVLGSVMNTVFTPCAGCGTHGGDGWRPSVFAIDLGGLGDLSRTAMGATWLRASDHEAAPAFRPGPPIPTGLERSPASSATGA